jgi:TP901 family phage tail tape measure protein
MAVVGADISIYSRKVGRDVPAIAKRATTAIARTGRAGARSFRLLGSTARAATGVIGKLGGAVTRAAGAVTRLAAGVARRTFYAVSAGAAAATYEAVNFQHAMAEVGSIAGRSRSEIDRLGRSVQEMAVKYGKAPKEMAGALYQAISAGVTRPDEAMKLLDVASRAAIAGVTDVKTAVDVLTSAMNAYGGGVAFAQQASDILFETVRRGKTTFPELAATLGRVMAIGSQTGVSLEQLGAAITTLTKGGIQTDLAVTSLRQTLVSILKPSKEALDLAKELGLEFNAQALAAKGLGGFMADVKDATRGNAEAMATLFPNVRALSGVMSLAGEQADEFQRQLKGIAGASGATAKAFSWMDDALLGMKQLWAQMRVAMAEIGKVLLPTVNRIVEGSKARWAALTEWVRTNSDRLAMTVLDAYNWLREKVGSVLGWIKGDNESVWDGIASKVSKVWAWIVDKWNQAKPMLSGFMTWLKRLFDGGWRDALFDAYLRVEQWVGDLLDYLTKQAPEWIEIGVGWVDSFMQGLEAKDGGIVGKVVKLILSIGTELMKHTATFVEWGFQLAKWIAKGLWEGLQPALTDLLASIGEWMTNYLKQMPYGIGPLIEASSHLGDWWARGGAGESPYGEADAPNLTPEQLRGALGGRQQGEAVEARVPAGKTAVTNNFYYPTDRDMHEQLAADLARLNRRGRAAPAPSF